MLIGKLTASILAATAMLFSALTVSSVSLAPTTGALYGGYVPGGQAAITAFESTIGRKLAIDNHFWSWTDPWPTTSFERWDVDNGRIPMVTWDGPNTTLDSITNGSQDAVIRAHAVQAKNFGDPFFVRWGYEMDGNWFPWSGAENGNDPSKFVAAWKHIVDIFRSVGATNAVWVWTVNNGDQPNVAWNRFSNYYPGDDYVDWVGIDGYNWGTSRSWSKWESFTQVFSYGGSGSPYNTYASRKPIMIGETGSVEAGGDKGAWYASIPSELQQLPSIKAVVFFEGAHSDIDMGALTSAGSLAGYKQMVASATFNPPASSPGAAKPASTTRPTISGTAAVGQTLAGGDGSWSGSPTSFSRQWQRCPSAYGQAVLADGPLGYWHFDETSGTTAADASPAGADGTYSAARLGQSGAFPGSTSVLLLGAQRASVSFGDRYDFSGRAPFTLEAWVAPAALDGFYRRLFSKEAVDARGREGYLVWLTKTGIGFERWASDWRTQIVSSTPLPVGTWSDVVATYDGAGMRLYVNGVQVATGGSSLNLPALATPFTINGVSGSGGDYLTGYVDEPAVYDKALTAAQVKSHYQAASGGGCSDVAGATGATYVPASADAGSSLQLEVTATNAAGSTTATSAQTAPIAG